MKFTKVQKAHLKEIIDKHGKWLRREEGGERANLMGVDLSGANLTRANLMGADLSGAILRATILRGAILRATILRRADLSGAILGNADLRGAILREADLRRADLSGAILGNADLRGAILREADLRRADLSGAILREADLTGAGLDKTYCQVARIGSRKAITTYCVEDDNVICGCWRDSRGGTLAEFEERIEAVYGAEGGIPNSKYYTQYMAAIQFFKAMKELNAARKDC